MSSNSDMGIGDLLEQEMAKYDQLAEDYTKLNHHYAMAMSKITELEKYQWISVTDRLPEKGVNVLVTDGKYFMVTWREFTLNDTALWINNTSDYADEEWGAITHWMPLPKPPKE